MRLGLSWASLVVLGAVVAGCGSEGPAGPKGDKGDPGTGTPSVSAVTPTSAFLARTIDVTISGNGTAWSDQTTVDFGDKIKVNKVTVASETGIVANITIDPAAALGPRDVTVKDEAGTETYKGAFDISSPLKLELSGTQAQGSIIFGHARGLDFSTPFDTTATGDGFFTPLVYTNIAFKDAPGTVSQVNSATDYTVDYATFVDIDAAAGSASDVNILSGPPGDVVQYPSPAAFTLTARTAKAITPNAGTSDKIAKPFDNLLYSYTPANGSARILDISLNPADPDGSPTVFFLPKSGKFADLFGRIDTGGTDTMTQAWYTSDLFYAVAIDLSGVANYSPALKVKETMATGGAEKEPNDSDTAAMTNGALALPYVVEGATLASLNDEDWYAVQLTAADMNKVISVQTTGFDGQVDTVVDILDDMGNSLGGPSDDQGYLDSLDSPPIKNPGTYFVHITASPSGYFDVAHNKYDLIIRLK